jgi:hypothetical protein
MNCAIRIALLGVLVLTACRAGELPMDKSKWTFVGGDWSVVGNSLVQSDADHLNQAVYRSEAYASPTLSVRFRIRNVGGGVQAAGLLLCSTDSRAGYYVHYDARNDQIILSRNSDDGRHEVTRQHKVRIDPDRWHEARTTIANGKIEVFLDGKRIIAAEDDGPRGGLVGLYTSQGAVEYTSVNVAGDPMPLPNWRVRESWEVPREQHGATIMETKVIAKEPGRYIGWPTVCRRRNGELLVVFSGDRDEHVCPWGKVQLVRSADDGKTWTAPASICNTPLDDRDAGIIETKAGTLVVNWFTSLAFESYARNRAKAGSATHQQWLYHAEKLTPEIRNQWFGYWTRRSEDGGKTWLDPVRHLGTTPHGPIELADGRLLMVGRRGGKDGIEMVVEQSTDDARSWQELAIIKQDPEDDPSQYYEPHLVEAADGTLVAMFRFHYHPGKSQKRDLNGCYLRQSESHDGGKTWTTAHPTPLLGYPPHLIQLKDGRLLCVWGRRTPPYGEYACLSNDNGKTWDVDNQVRLAAAMNGDLGYPASTELPDGRILTVYYQVDKAGERTCLMGTIWRPAPKP